MKVYMVDQNGNQVELSNSFQFQAEPWHFEFNPEPPAPKQDSEKFLLLPHEKLNKVLRDQDYMYKNAPHPGMCWILEEVLGIDAYNVVQEGFNAMEDSYETYLRTPTGSRRYFDDGEAAKITVMWTKEQKKLLREWWEYIPPELRG